MPSTKHKAEEIKRICIEANPMKQTENTSMLLKGVFNGIINYRDETIRLADILHALGKNIPQLMTVTTITSGALVDRRFTKLLKLWIFSHDSLDYHTEHHPKVIDFIWSLLVKK